MRSNIKENEEPDNLVNDKVLEQILNNARPYLKKSIQDWIIEQATDYQRKYINDDLFKLSFNEFIDLPAKEQRNWRHQILREKKDWLLNKLSTTKAEWLLILGGKVEIASPSLNELPTKEKIYELARSKGFAPFIFVKDPLIEESNDDINPISWSALENYDFYLPEIKIGPKTLGDSIKSKIFRVRSVIDWDISPFCRVNPDRKGLVGRKLLIEMSLYVILRGDMKTTEILH